MIDVLYFAWVRERIGQGAEQIELVEGVNTVETLLNYLRDKGAPYEEALKGSHLQVAVNQVHADPETPVKDQDEIAIFPPVSGG
ncbi:MAG: molybdopterin converting factor subunit 1 [Magnetococcales bacterium]|nr:molybdopterin converting factor subunit 1 [Magnetococcales bacterium]